MDTTEGNHSLLCSFSIWTSASRPTCGVLSGCSDNLISSHIAACYLSSVLNCNFWRKNTELVPCSFHLSASTHLSLFPSVFFCLLLSADPSAWMKMTSSGESKETPHKAITNKPDVPPPPSPPFPLCREGIEWSQVPFSKNEFSNFS